jgi:outer membrane lipoprotein-sorting protein
VYDKGLAQVTARKLDNALGSSPAALLAGNNDLEKHYQLKNQGVSDGLDWLEATPKHSDGTFKSVRMGFKSGELLRMDMEDNFGQHTTLTFSGLQKNPKLPASRFSFTPPKGVDVLAE